MTSVHFIRLPRKLAFANGDRRHWHQRDERLTKLVHKRIATEGPLMAKDFEHTGKKIGEWKTKPAKRALEYLFMPGDFIVPSGVTTIEFECVSNRLPVKSCRIQET